MTPEDEEEFTPEPIAAHSWVGLVVFMAISIGLYIAAIVAH